jgi:hypothetical protein
MPGRSVRIGFLVVLPLALGMVGCCAGGIISLAGPFPPRKVTTELTLPLPHHVPRYPGNLTLRFAMVHDVIHERFPHHGPDYYRARNREVKESLAKKRPTAKSKEADEYFRLLDDLGVGLSFLGKHAQAVEVIQGKLKEQQALGYKGRGLYSTYANLGTVLILWQLSEGLGDVPTAKKRIGESITWIRKAIEVYPQAHFGRESWQVVLEEFLLAVLDNPKLLLRYDMIGDRLDQPIDPEKAVCFDEKRWTPPSRTDFFELSLGWQAARYLKEGSALRDLSEFRACITRVGAEGDWKKESKTSLSEPAPFDEPALGIVGMWRMGAGANPHFALALGEIMLRVGQRYIAWTAYERAWQLRDLYWADKSIQDGFGYHCRARQKLIEASLPKDDWVGIRRRCENELAHGQRFQKEYQAYESRRIEEGATLDDPHFYDDFERNRKPIASPVGQEDRTYVRRERIEREPIGFELAANCLLFAGLFAFSAAALPLVFGKRRSAVLAPPGEAPPASEPTATNKDGAAPDRVD